MSRKIVLACFAYLVTTTTLHAQSTAPYRPLGTLRDQAVLQHQWLQYRLDSVMPMLVREQGVEMCVISMREYNEDPVFPALVSPTTFAARRRTIYIFHDRGPDQGIERLALGGSSQGGLYQALRGTVHAEHGRREELAWDLISTAFSNEVIMPGVTTTDDVV